ncbi:DUF7282 domain-containing protein [Haloarcula onubensis]|uniref:DUF7282 domain-containing protein n=1 Tax=Haloarcula onubensis TaxID=2950539 RepID=A0ABU2FMZ7_9EURY|nr:hypothetical protein [Halomicroarcula sp. S3CR25-11]MDS0282123.1 hypothetical protein [Halomicroarcula sp. S3CR25-11]
MEPDSNNYRASYRRLATLAVVLSLALVPLSGLGAAQQAGTAGNATTTGNQSYVAIQGDECTPITSFSDNESAIEYYDYRLPAEYADNPYANATGSAFGSEGTLDLQEPNGSIVFLYTDTTDNSTYLVFIHGQEANDSSTGGAATFNITGLPADGDWTVRDDDYNDTSSADNWTVTDTTSNVDWIWSEAATDGGVYSDIDNDTNVTVDPAFNEDAALFGQNGNGTVETWQVLSNDSDNVTRTDLDLNESLQIAAGTCGDTADGATTDNATNATDGNATVSFDDQESNGTSVTVQNVTVPRDGYVAIHNDSLLDGDAVGSVVGVSDYLEAGSYENVTVNLYDVPGASFNESELTENQTLIAMPHEETTGDQSYAFVSSNGTDDGPYTVNGTPVTDDAAITVVNETGGNATNGNATATPDNTTTTTGNATATPDNTTDGNETDDGSEVLVPGLG